jgi:hypothetical protein
MKSAAPRRRRSSWAPYLAAVVEESRRCIDGPGCGDGEWIQREKKDQERRKDWY